MNPVTCLLLILTALACTGCAKDIDGASYLHWWLKREGIECLP